MDKAPRKKSKTIKVNFTPSELEAALIACSNYISKTKNWKQRTQVRATNKLREALLNSILN